jgi:phosphinothricin acetyltransferase
MELGLADTVSEKTETTVMAEIRIRRAERSDLARLAEIYNYYVNNTPITFDLEPVTIEDRAAWLEHHSNGARYQLFVADEAGCVLGWAGTGRFRDRAAYDTSVETTIYCAPEATGRGIGSTMYHVLFEAIRNEDINRVLAGITIPNEASVRLHKRFGFKPIGTFSEVGRKFGKYWDVLWMQRPLSI